MTNTKESDFEYTKVYLDVTWVTKEQRDWIQEEFQSSTHKEPHTDKLYIYVHIDRTDYEVLLEDEQLID